MGRDQFCNAVSSDYVRRVATRRTSDCVLCVIIPGSLAIIWHGIVCRQLHYATWCDWLPLQSTSI